MCGLVGWISPRGRVEAELLDRVRDALAHRGPDGAGRWISPDRRVGLGHRRLSIVDLSDGGAQPMSADDRATIAFNGEIYNHAELRRELEEAGVRFRSDHSDTEVLLRGYLHWGLDALLERCDGMFAFALHDRATDRLVLVRDAIGIKPLYLATTRRGELLFASEAKAFLEHPDHERGIDAEALPHFLSFRAVPAPRTLLANVECLAAGEVVEVDVASGRRTRRRWWDPLDAARRPAATLDEARDEIADALDRAVGRRLQADVPVGLFLSGGVDSAYLAMRAASRRDGLDAWTVGYPGHARYDETADARDVAERARADHHLVSIDEDDFAAALPHVAWHQDEPIAAPVCTSVWFLSRAAREAGVPVVLAGEGSDELFVGYESWMKLRDAERWNRRLPDLPGRLVRRGASLVGDVLLPWTSPAREVLRRAGAGQPLFWSGALDFGEAGKRRLLGSSAGSAADTWAEAIEPLRRDFLERADARDTTLWMTYVDLRLRLPQLMLPRLDKMGMAFSIEGRVPFLSREVVERVVGLPAAWRGGAGDTPKALFKEIAARDLPREFVFRTKRGFQAPVSEWRESSFGRTWRPALVEFANRTGLFDPAGVRELVERRADRRWFSLVNFALWHELFVEPVLGRALPETAESAIAQAVAA